MKELLDHAVDRLSPGQDGKRKVLHETVLENIDEFVSTFKARNICDDKELDAVVEQVRAINDGIEIGDLRKNEGLRESFREGVEKIKAQMDELSDDAPVRLLGD